MIRNVLAFAAASTLETAGCFAFWIWLRQERSALYAAAGIASLLGFATILTRIDVQFAGRAHAAYGGVYIAASLVWLWAVENQQPTMMDLPCGSGRDLRMPRDAFSGNSLPLRARVDADNGFESTHTCALRRGGRLRYETPQRVIVAVNRQPSS